DFSAFDGRRHMPEGHGTDGDGACEERKGETDARSLRSAKQIQDALTCRHEEDLLATLNRRAEPTGFQKGPPECTSVARETLCFSRRDVSDTCHKGCNIGSTSRYAHDDA